MRNVLAKGVEKINAHFIFNNFFLRYEVMWENIVELARPQLTVWHMRIACWMLKATNTHSYYIILIAFPLQQWLHERTWVFVICTLPVLFISIPAGDLSLIALSRTWDVGERLIMVSWFLIHGCTVRIKHMLYLLVSKWSTWSTFVRLCSRLCSKYVERVLHVDTGACKEYNSVVELCACFWTK